MTDPSDGSGDLNTDESLRLSKVMYTGTGQDSTPPWRSMVHDPAPPPEIDLRIPGYDLIDVIGRGGMGMVYKARQHGLERLVAIKVILRGLSDDPEFQQRFSDEVKAAGSLQHENIVSSLACGSVDGRPFLTMEFIEGSSLAQLLKKQGRLNEKDALELTRQVAVGLQFAWERKLIHRDIKPENILITSRGTAKICDLGLCRAADSPAHITQTGQINCTPAYASPEQLRGKRNLDTRTDIYSLGITLYHLLTGVLPYEGRSPADLFVKHSTELPVPPNTRVPSISAATSTLVLEMMAKRRRGRPKSPGDVATAIEAILKGSGAMPPTIAPAAGSESRHRTPSSRPTPILEIAEIPVIPTLTAKTYVNGETVVLELKGRLSDVLEETLQKEFDRLERHNHLRIVVDCDGLAYVNSRGVSVFISVIDELRERGGDLKIARLNKQSLTVFKRLGLTQFIQVFNSVSDAVRAFETPIQDFLSDGGLDTFVGVPGTMLFHTSACAQVGPKITITLYASRKEARAAGFGPCPECCGASKDP